MNIEQLKSGSYRIVQMYKGKRYRVTIDHKPTKKEATILMAEAMQETLDKGERGTFEEYANKYISSKENILSVTTIGGYKVLLRNMPMWWKEMELFEITAENYQKAVSEYSATHSPKTTANMSSFCSSVLGMFRPNFNAKITLPQKQAADIYIPTPEEVSAILEYEKGTKFEAAFRLAMYGLRKGEICAINPLTDLDGNLLHINKSMARTDDGEFVIKAPKTVKSDREVYIDDQLVELIRGKESIYEGHPDVILRELHRAQKHLGIQEFKFHAFRHYFVTELSDSNVPEADILALGGYSTDNVMKRVYRHSRAKEDIERKKNAMQILAQKIGAGN